MVVGDTYGGIDGLIALHVVVLHHAVVGLAEGDAGAAVGDQACRGKVSMFEIQHSTARGNIQVSMGEKHPKKPADQSRAVSGLLELIVPAASPRATLKRFFHDSMSLLSMGPLLPPAGAGVGAGAPIGACCSYGAAI